MDFAAAAGSPVSRSSLLTNLGHCFSMSSQIFQRQRRGAESESSSCQTNKAHLTCLLLKGAAAWKGRKASVRLPTVLLTCLGPCCCLARRKPRRMLKQSRPRFGTRTPDLLRSGVLTCKCTGKTADGFTQWFKVACFPNLPKIAIRRRTLPVQLKPDQSQKHSNILNPGGKSPEGLLLLWQECSILLVQAMRDARVRCKFCKALQLKSCSGLRGILEPKVAQSSRAAQISLDILVSSFLVSGCTLDWKYDA